MDPQTVFYLHLRMLTSWRVFQRQSVTGDRFAVTCYGQGCSRGPEGNFLGPSCQSQSKLWTLAKARRQFFDILRYLGKWLTPANPDLQGYLLLGLG